MFLFIEPSLAIFLGTLLLPVLFIYFLLTLPGQPDQTSRERSNSSAESLGDEADDDSRFELKPLVSSGRNLLILMGVGVFFAFYVFMNLALLNQVELVLKSLVVWAALCFVIRKPFRYYLESHYEIENSLQKSILTKLLFVSLFLWCYGGVAFINTTFDLGEPRLVETHAVDRDVIYIDEGHTSGDGITRHFHVDVPVSFPNEYQDTFYDIPVSYSQYRSIELEETSIYFRLHEGGLGIKYATGVSLTPPDA